MLKSEILKSSLEGLNSTFELPEEKTVNLKMSLLILSNLGSNNLPATWEIWVRSLGQEDPLEKGMATHFNILAWRIPGTEESTGSQKVGHD